MAAELSASISLSSAVLEFSSPQDLVWNLANGSPTRVLVVRSSTYLLPTTLRHQRRSNLNEGCHRTSFYTTFFPLSLEVGLRQPTDCLATQCQHVWHARNAGQYLQGPCVRLIPNAQCRNGSHSKDRLLKSNYLVGDLFIEIILV